MDDWNIKMDERYLFQIINYIINKVYGMYLMLFIETGIKLFF